mgnify:CR=1 FL=1|tara:strand:- start:755 stop:1381 length:627 start_codon:yes stop_codon:yes gene_type:complete
MVNKQKFKGSTLFRKRCVDNILKVYNNPEFEGGANWYNEAHELSNSLAIEFGLTNLQVAGIIAAFSPLKSWDENKKIAKQFLLNGNGKHTKVMKDKARNIKAYNDSMQREFILTTLNGNKISNFFLNIAYPNETTSVTVDRHAIAVILGRNIKENEGSGITDIQYEFLASCYRQASEVLGVLPNQVQSVTWVKWRKLKNAKKFDNVPF